MSTMRIINVILIMVLSILASTTHIKPGAQLSVKDGTSYTIISYLFQ